VNKVPITNVDRIPRRSPSAEKALQQLTNLPVTEACVSGSCDICLNQAGPCDVIGQGQENSHPSSRPEKNK